MSFSKQNKFTLINLGGPRNQKEIKIFLKDLFEDPYVFDLPLWEPLRRLFGSYIAKTRAPKVAASYASMGYGGGSPLVDETLKQAHAIEEILNKKTNSTWKGDVAMTCGFPNIRNYLNSDTMPSATHVHLPLFPQFSRSTTLSLAAIYEKTLHFCPVGKRGWIDPFVIDQRFIELTAEFILNFFQGNLSSVDFPHFTNTGKITNWENFDLVFSAHGIPMRLIEKGDKYVSQTEECVKLIEAKLRLMGFTGRIHLSFQSRVGRAKWTEPNTRDTLLKLGQKRKEIAVYPISFVSDHLETLEEIGVELRDVAISAGAKSYLRIPALGIYPKFIEYLSDLILEAQGEKKNKVCLCQSMGGEKLSGCHFEETP